MHWDLVVPCGQVGEEKRLMLTPSHFNQRLVSREMRVKRNSLPAKQQVAFKPGNCGQMPINYLATSHALCLR